MTTNQTETQRQRTKFRLALAVGGLWVLGKVSEIGESCQ